jgi:hypothetical protein
MTDKGSGNLGFVPSAPPAYAGSAWRARFLRAPKIALELAARDDFIELKELAFIRLGLKTGADSFFFLERLPNPNGEKELVSRRGLILVKGHDGWRGELASADLRPAVLNPHQLFVGDARRFAVPNESKHLYLFPRPGKPRFGLPDYIRLGELQGIHQGDLVRSNGGDGGWFRQVRALVTSEWVLPYNSAYDYGAWHNPVSAVLNGRFVGVEPLNPTDSDLLGALLNSTFAAVGRLIEGVATGVEGAFDVGPPAARKIMLPDIRRLEASSRKNVLKLFHEIRAGGIMLAAPLRDGYVPDLRRELDSALLVGLGLSKGKAAVLLEKLYASYGRWRANIEDVETQMRGNRRQMQATGQSRNLRPTEAAGRRVWEEIEHLMPLFPNAFLSREEIMEMVNVPSAAVLPTSSPLFDRGVVRTKNKSIDLGTYERVRYVAMLRTLGIVGNVDVPVSASKAGAIADLFENEQVRFRNLAQENASKYVSGAEAATDVIEIARKHWHSACRKSGLAKPTAQQKTSKLN